MQVGDNLHGRERLPFRFIPNIQTRCTKIRKQIPIHVPIWDAVPQAFQFIYLVLPVSTCFHLGNNTLQKLHRFRFTGHSGIILHQTQQSPPVTPHEYRRFQRVGSSDKRLFSSMLPSGDAAPTTIILQIEKAVSGLYSNIRRLIFSNDRLLSRKERSISVLPLWKYIFTESRVS